MTSLRQRMTEDMQVRNLSPHTQTSYVQQVSLFARHFSKSPELLGPEEIRSYQVYLTNEKKLAPSSILIAVAALRFFYKVTLHKDWPLEEMDMLTRKTVLAALLITCVCTLIAKGEESDSAKQLIGIMETLNGLAVEAIPLAEQEFALLDARFKGDEYSILVAWLRTPAEKASGLVENDPRDGLCGY
jgi:integrase-like protein